MKIKKMRARLERRRKALEMWNPSENKARAGKAQGGYRMPGSPKQSG